MKDLITVIIPAYNVERYLENCLRSIISQTYQNLEIIIVNDGSADRTAAIIDKFASIDQRIIALHQQNQGVSAARNNALRIAKGEFIGFVDADDEIMPDMYEFLHHNLITYQADISHCGFELVKPKATVKFHGTGIRLLQNKYEAIVELLSGKRIEPSSCTKLFKKSILHHIFFASDIKTNEDLLFNIEAFKNAGVIIFEDVIKYRYIHNPTSASRSPISMMRLQDLSAVGERILKLLSDSPLKEMAQKFYLSKQLEVCKSIEKHHFRNTEFAKNLYSKLSKESSRKMGFRIWFLKITILDFPWLYRLIYKIYSLIFTKQQKWKNH